MRLESASSAEREELEAVLRSGVFARSPSLAQFLQYICQKHFEGKSGEIKEYNVAVEALGRPPDFDQKKDSIVRVEAHRLRKRLQEFYAGDGANHPVQIRIPPGTYAPVFVSLDAVDAAAGEEPPGRSFPADQGTPATGPLSKGRAVGRWWIPAALGVSAAVLTFYLASRDTHAEPAPAALVAVPAVGVHDSVRIMAGSRTARYVDDAGETWSGDAFYTGGESMLAPPRPISRTRDPGLFFARREGDFRYDIPLKPGKYELRLYFAEAVFGDGNVAGGGESSRVFGIRANGMDLFIPADIVADAGGSNTADIKVFPGVEPAPDGRLHLEFFALFKERPFVNAIELIPTGGDHMRPIRIATQEKAFRDKLNREWISDRFSTGGMVIRRVASVSGGDDPELYRSERYGNFSYVVPVAENRRYSVTLHFSENWFGPKMNGGGGDGSRVFDVFCNGRVLLKNFDIHAEAGSLQAVTKTFRGLEPNAQGKLRLDFVPVRNYALVNAIEVVDDSR